MQTVRHCGSCSCSGYISRAGHPSRICDDCNGAGHALVPRRLAIPNYETPMTPEDLSDAVRQVVDMARNRVGPDSIGAQQYHVEGEPQRFESMPLLGLIDYSIEEALDFINYGVMLALRLDRLRQTVEYAEMKQALAPESAPDATPGPWYPGKKTTRARMRDMFIAGTNMHNPGRYFDMKAEAIDDGTATDLEKNWFEHLSRAAVASLQDEWKASYEKD